MTRFHQLAAGFAILSIIIQTAYASFGICVASQYFINASKNVVGFSLWNDQGDNGFEYRSIYAAGQTFLENNGWKIHLHIGPPVFSLSGVKSISASNDKYGYFDVDTIQICNATRKSPTSIFRVYYTCLDTANSGYCTQDRINLESEWCRTSTALGSNSDTC